MHHEGRVYASLARFSASGKLSLIVLIRRQFDTAIAAEIILRWQAFFQTFRADARGRWHAPRSQFCTENPGRYGQRAPADQYHHRSYKQPVNGHALTIKTGQTYVQRYL